MEPGIDCNICIKYPVCFPPIIKPNHKHRWSLLFSSNLARRHCFNCNMTQELVSATKWTVTKTSLFGVDPKYLKCPQRRNNV